MKTHSNEANLNLRGRFIASAKKIRHEILDIFLAFRQVWFTMPHPQRRGQSNL